MKAEILILGVLHRDDMHPYEIKRRLKNAHVDSYIDFDVGTLYYAVGKLAKDGLIEERGRETVGNRAERTIYGITSEGRARFQDLLTETLAEIKQIHHPLFPALIFLHLADQAEASEIVADRLLQTRKLLAATKSFLDMAGPYFSVGMRLGLENAVAHQEVEAKWLEKLQSHLATGDIDIPDPDKESPVVKQAVSEFLDTLNDTLT